MIVERFASNLRIDKSSVYYWWKSKGLPTRRIGRLWKYQLSEVDEWVRAGGADEHAAPDEGSAKKAQITNKPIVQGPGRPKK